MIVTAAFEYSTVLPVTVKVLEPANVSGVLLPVRVMVSEVISKF